MEDLTAIEIQRGIKDGSLKAVDIVKERLSFIHAEDGKIGAFLETFDNEALAAAEKVDAMVAEGKELPRLAGVPIAIKDNMAYQGHTVSCSSKMLEKHVAAYTATAVQRLIDAGAIIIGRTNMDEFAMGSSTESSYFQVTHNPWDLERVPGGSSGGAAAAVAAGFVPVALGSDTGGSIRQPAALCGVVGMKPTYGRVSRYGLVALASSLDQIGPFARTAEDTALILEVMEGKDEKDATSHNLSETTIPELITPSVEGMKIGVPKEFFKDGLEPGVESAIKEAIATLEKAGAEIVEVSLPLSEYALPAYYIIQPAEASSNLARFDGMRYGTRAEGNLMDSYLNARGEGFGREVKRRIILGTYILSAGYHDAYYKKALAVRTAIFDELHDVLKTVDVIVGPTTPTTAWKLGEKIHDPLAMYLADIFTTSANIAGTPGISVPCGMSDGLPVGLQILGGSFDDGKVLQVAAAYEKLRGAFETPNQS
jgi:aspartyl-tRNA(Asn)/glutamyl-tRNA(Gln) amidotransferase subunit A